MNIIISDTDIIMQTKNASASYTLFLKPDIADYGNITTRPLVTSYHLIRETIWERLCQCMKTLESSCQDNPHFGCYALALSALYPSLLSNSQAKNILYYGSSNASSFLSVLQDFMRFLREDSSLASLPCNPSVFSGLANNAWHAAIIDLDSCDSFQTVCDAISKVRINGAVLLFTVSDIIDGNMQELLTHAEKTAFSACTLYSLTTGQPLFDVIFPCTAESCVLTRTETLLAQTEELQQFAQNITPGAFTAQDCLYAIELLCQAEDTLFASYDYLDNPKLPVYASSLKEAFMDCYISLTEEVNAALYTDRLHAVSQIFFSAMETEFYS